MFPTNRKRGIAWAGACLAAVFSTVAVVQSAYAATGCRVDYSVTSQWSTGFQGSVTVTNLGDRLDGWRLTFAFPHAGQRVSQGWNGTWTQSGAAVTVTNAAWNAAVAPGASVNLGFTGAWSGTNPEAVFLALNGTSCAGAAG